MHTATAEDRSAEKVTIDPDDSRRNQSITLLIVDDDSVNRIVLKGTLSKFGYNILIAEDGKLALDVFRKNKPDLILMDIMMPNMDGYTAAAIIKKECENNYTPILFITAMIDENALAKCVEAGGDDFLVKPYSPVILKARIDALLRTRDIYRQKQEQHEILSLYQQEIRHDLDIAERILSKISSEDTLDTGNINYYLSPMEQLNGDIIFTARKPDGGQQFLLGDFTGHGLGAAIGGLVVFDVFKTMTAKGFSILQIIPEINRKLREILPTGRFLAAGLVELDAEHTVATIWNGGLPDIYIRGAEPDVCRTVTSRHLPLGVLENSELDVTTERVLLTRGDRIFLYSDGVTEAQNSAQEFFSEDRLQQCIYAESETDQLFHTLLENIKEFCGDSPQRDDISLLEIICDPSRVRTDEEANSRTKSHITATTWNLGFSVNADTIKQTDIIPPLVQMIVDVQGLHHCRQQLYLILSELYSNILEHGLLDLDSRLKSHPDGFIEYYEQRKDGLNQLVEGTVSFNLEHVPCDQGGKLTLHMCHDGDGFDVESTQSLLPGLNENIKQYGRGIKLVQSLSQRMEYEDFGRSVEVEYVWENQKKTGIES